MSVLAHADPEPLTQIDLLRHGAVVTPELFCAPPQEPLSVSGWQQLTQATAQGCWSHLISSPSRRCHDFARQLAQRLGCSFQVEPDLREMQFGTWVGKTQLQVWEQDAALLQQLWRDPLHFSAPGTDGESMRQFIERVQRAWLRVQQEHRGQRVLIVTHAGVMRVILAEVLEIAYQKSLRFQIGHAQLTRITVDASGASCLLGHGWEHAPC